MSLGQGWGWVSTRTIGVFALTVALFIFFVLYEKRTQAPIFNLQLFSHRHYRAGLMVPIFYSIGFFATTFLLTIYLQGAVHLSPIHAGLMLVPLSAPQLIMGPLGGSLADRYGPARSVVLGVLLLAIGGFWLGHLGVQFSAWSVILPLILMSCATGIVWPALTKAVMTAAPRGATGSASGMFFTFRNVGMALSFTLALVVAEVSLPPAVAAKIYLGTSNLLNPAMQGALIHATNMGFWVFVGFYLIALVCALPLLRSHLESDTKAGQRQPKSSMSGT